MIRNLSPLLASCDQVCVEYANRIAADKRMVLCRMLCSGLAILLGIRDSSVYRSHRPPCHPAVLQPNASVLIPHDETAYAAFERTRAGNQTTAIMPVMKTPETLCFTDRKLVLIDQTRLPGELVTLDCSSVAQTHDAIQRLVVRGRTGDRDRSRLRCLPGGQFEQCQSA